MKRENLKIKMLVGALAVLIGIASCGTPDRVRTLESVEKLQGTEKKEERDKLIEAADNGNREVRAGALYALAQLGDDKAVDVFIRRALEDDDFNVRVNALRGIRKLAILKDGKGTYKVFRELTEDELILMEAGMDVTNSVLFEIDRMDILKAVNYSLTNGPEAVRIEAMKTAAEYRSPSSAVGMMANLTNRNAVVRMNAAKYIVSLPYEECLTALEEAGQNEESLKAGAVIKGSLGKMRSLQLKPLPEQFAVEADEEPEESSTAPAEVDEDTSEVAEEVSTSEYTDEAEKPDEKPDEDVSEESETEPEADTPEADTEVESGAEEVSDEEESAEEKETQEEGDELESADPSEGDE